MKEMHATWFEAEDGARFDLKDACIAYEEQQKGASLYKKREELQEELDHFNSNIQQLKSPAGIASWVRIRESNLAYIDKEMKFPAHKRRYLAIKNAAQTIAHSYIKEKELIKKLATFRETRNDLRCQYIQNERAILEYQRAMVEKREMQKK